MPALSKKQQKFFGIVRAIQKGEQTPTTPETAKAAADTVSYTHLRAHETDS